MDRCKKVIQKRDHSLDSKGKKMNYYHTQKTNTPLFPNILWSRPENKQTAGKLLILGGHGFSFSAPFKAYEYALAAGAGSVRLVLPDSIKKSLPNYKNFLDICTFSPSTLSGGLSRKSLSDILDESEWADGILLSGSFGKNNETSLLLESYFIKANRPLTLVGDTLETVQESFPRLLKHNNSQTNFTVAISFAQLQRLVTELRFPHAVTFSMPLLKLVHVLHLLTQEYPTLHILTYRTPYFFVASNGQVVTHETVKEYVAWRTLIGSTSSVFMMQNPSKILESLTTSLIEI